MSSSAYYHNQGTGYRWDNPAGSTYSTVERAPVTTPYAKGFNVPKGPRFIPLKTTAALPMRPTDAYSMMMEPRLINMDKTTDPMTNFKGKKYRKGDKRVPIPRHETQADIDELFNIGEDPKAYSAKKRGTASMALKNLSGNILQHLRTVSSEKVTADAKKLTFDHKLQIDELDEKVIKVIREIAKDSSFPGIKNDIPKLLSTLSGRKVVADLVKEQTGAVRISPEELSATKAHLNTSEGLRSLVNMPEFSEIVQDASPLYGQLISFQTGQTREAKGLSTDTPPEIDTPERSTASKIEDIKVRDVALDTLNRQTREEENLKEEHKDAVRDTQDAKDDIDDANNVLDDAEDKKITAQAVVTGLENKISGFEATIDKTENRINDLVAERAISRRQKKKPKTRRLTNRIKSEKSKLLSNHQKLADRLLKLRKAVKAVGATNRDILSAKDGVTRANEVLKNRTAIVKGKKNEQDKHADKIISSENKLADADLLITATHPVDVDDKLAPKKVMRLPSKNKKGKPPQEQKHQPAPEPAPEPAPKPEDKSLQSDLLAHILGAVFNKEVTPLNIKDFNDIMGKTTDEKMHGVQLKPFTFPSFEAVAEALGVNTQVDIHDTAIKKKILIDRIFKKNKDVAVNIVLHPSARNKNIKKWIKEHA